MKRVLSFSLSHELHLDLTLDIELHLDLDLVYALGEIGGKIVAALERNDASEALRLARPLLKSNDTYTVRRATLLVDLLETVTAKNVVEQRQAYRRYAAHYAEYAYVGYFKLEQLEQRNYSKQRQIVVDLFWWMQVVMAREEQGFPAWEGIRIVAEGRTED